MVPVHTGLLAHFAIDCQVQQNGIEPETPMLSLLFLAAIMLLAGAYRTRSFTLKSHKRCFSTLNMAPIGSKEMFNVFIDSLRETNEGNDTIHTPRMWSKNKTNNDTNTTDLKEDLENYNLSIKDRAPSKSKAEIFELFIESDDDCKEEACILDTPDAWKKGANKSAKQYDEMKEKKKAVPFWLDDNDDTSERDDTPLAWKKKKS